MKRLLAISVLSLICFALYASGEVEVSNKIPIKVLIFPKFEIGEFENDTAGEAQAYYLRYLKGGDEYDIPGGIEGNKLYVKDGIALYITGIGKMQAALSVMAVLNDSRFDFSNAYILSTGCAGSAVETTVMGDVFVLSSIIDFDLGHHADARELSDPDGTTWFHDDAYDNSSIIRLNPSLVEKVYALVKDTHVETTPKTKAFMGDAFDNASWATRDPRVMLGTTATGDNYWKGYNNHKNALLMVQTYNCPDPFVTTEMEEIAVAFTVRRMGLIDRFISIRSSVNMDVFMNGDTPESLWSDADDLSKNGGNKETADIFDTTLNNVFKVGSIIIDSILDGTI